MSCFSQSRIGHFVQDITSLDGCVKETIPQCIFLFGKPTSDQTVEFLRQCCLQYSASLHLLPVSYECPLTHPLIDNGISPDPRVAGPSRYDREEIVAVVTDFYKSLAKLPYIEPTDVLFPPAIGWLNINKETSASLAKSEETVKVQVRRQRSLVPRGGRIMSLFRSF